MEHQLNKQTKALIAALALMTVALVAVPAASAQTCNGGIAACSQVPLRAGECNGIIDMNCTYELNGITHSCSLWVDGLCVIG
ncbi:MAG: hypothetical protein QOG31_398 [Thermoplasmata archaeon]|jgi:hypothetical protein|nr:hypothetical protein [Thermoplasmata archaeon]